MTRSLTPIDLTDLNHLLVTPVLTQHVKRAAVKRSRDSGSYRIFSPTRKTRHVTEQVHFFFPKQEVVAAM